MPPTGTALAADLSVLLAIGKIDLPQLANTYVTVNRALAATASGDSDAFSVGYAGKGDGGASGALYEIWSQLRDQLQDALGQSALSLQAASTAVVSIADTYAANDAAAQASINSVWQNGPPAMYVLDGDQPLPATPPAVIMSR